MIDGDPGHLLRVLHREGAKPHCVEQLKDCCVGANSKGQRENRGGRKSGIETQQPDSEPQVLPERFYERLPTYRADLFFDFFRAAHVHARGADGVFAGHPAAHFLKHGGVEIRPQFLVHFTLGLLFAKECPQPASKTSQK